MDEKFMELNENLNDIPIGSEMSERLEKAQDQIFENAMKEAEAFREKYLDNTLDTTYDANGAKIQEYNANADVAADTKEQFGNYIIDGYYETSGDFAGLTFPERLDVNAKDAIEANDENIIGEPFEDISNWHQQEMPNSCAVACQEFAIESLLDIDLDESQYREIAERHGYTDEGGTPFLFAGDVAKEFGLQSEFNESFTLEEAMEKIQNGEKIIAAIDNSMLYFPNDPFRPFLTPQVNHAVEITGFDTSDPNDIKVIINDPGYPNGAGNVYSWDYFRSCSADMYISIHK